MYIVLRGCETVGAVPYTKSGESVTIIEHSTVVGIKQYALMDDNRRSGSSDIFPGAITYDRVISCGSFSPKRGVTVLLFRQIVTSLY